MMVTDVSCDHWAWGAIIGKGPMERRHYSLSHLDDDRYIMQKLIKTYTYNVCILL